MQGYIIRQKNFLIHITRNRNVIFQTVQLELHFTSQNDFNKIYGDNCCLINSATERGRIHSNTTQPKSILKMQWGNLILESMHVTSFEKHFFGFSRGENCDIGQLIFIGCSLNISIEYISTQLLNLRETLYPEDNDLLAEHQ